MHKILENGNTENHFSVLKKMTANADTLIVASPFLSEGILQTIALAKQLKKVILYTTLEKYTDTADKILLLDSYLSLCAEKGIDCTVKIDDDLHGKVYLCYQNETPTGMVITSGNFTNNGMQQNHEYGVFSDDALLQQQMMNILQKTRTYELTFDEIHIFKEKAEEYKKNHPQTVQPRFELRRIWNKKIAAAPKDRPRFFIKPIGTHTDPIIDSELTSGVIGFAKRPKAVRVGDILIFHAVKARCIVGYGKVTEVSDVPDFEYSERWPWKAKYVCESVPFSRNWKAYALHTEMLREEFLKNHSGIHITNAGGDTLGSLQWGNDKLQLTEAFAMFIVNKIRYKDEK